MERLTERTTDGILVKEDYGEKALRTLYSCYGEKPYPHYTNCEEGYCAMEKLADYEDAEEQGLLLRLPCKFGDTVYKIPSKVNYDLNVLNGHQENNRVYRQVVRAVHISQRGYYLETEATDITDEILVDKFYGETWFLTREEAEAKLKEMGGNHE